MKIGEGKIMKVYHQVSRLLLRIFLLAILAGGCPWLSYAEEAQSPAYTLETSAISASSASAGSANYQLMWSTVGETPGGHAASANFILEGGFPAQLRTFGEVSPTIESVVPDTGPAVGGTGVTIQGSGFSPDSTALIGANLLLNTSVPDGATLAGVTPAGPLGPADVTVSNSSGSFTFRYGFVYNDGLPPTVTSVEPNLGGPMLVVTIRGSHFTTTQTTTVRFGSKPAVALHVVDANEMLAIVPPDGKFYQPIQPLLAGLFRFRLPLAMILPIFPIQVGGGYAAVDVTVTTPNGQGTRPRGFKYRIPGPADPFQEPYDPFPPLITGLVPADGSVTNLALANIVGTYEDERLGVDFRTVRLLVDGVDVTREARITRPQVSWNPPVAFSPGFHTVSLSLADTLGNEAVPRQSTFRIAPLITNLSPADGSFTNQKRPAITANFLPIVGGSAIDLSAVVLKVDAIDVTAQAVVTASGITYTPSVDFEDSSHTIAIDLADLNGNTAPQASGTFIVDTIPPTLYFTTPVDQQFLNEASFAVGGYVSDSHLNNVTVNGTAATINETSFELNMDLAEGENVLSAIARDFAGNERIHTIVITLDMAPPVIAITSPADQSVIDYTSVTVQGTINDPDAGVVVGGGGLAVMISPGVWRALSVPLVIGENVIEAVAFDLAGNQALASITVLSNTQTVPIALAVNPQSGSPPLNVTLTPSTMLVSVVNFHYDWEGDGTVDFTTALSNPVNHTYDQVDFYAPSVTAEASDGTFYSAQALVNVHEPVSVAGTVAVTDPVDVEVDRDGLIYVLSRSQARIFVFSFDETTSSFIPANTIIGSWSSPEGFDLDLEDLSIFVADTGNNRAEKLVNDGAGNYSPDPTFGTGGSIGSFGSEPSQFDAPFDVAVSEDDTVYVSDRNNNRIQQFDSQGNFLNEFGTTGSADAQFNNPAGVVYNKLTLEVLVADQGNHRIQAFDPDNVFKYISGAFGTGQGQFNSPAHVSADEVFDGVFVTDSGNNRIQLLDRNGNFLQELAGLGLVAPRASSPLPFPNDQMIPGRLLYIADTGNNRVLRIVVPQGSSADDPLAPYWNLIAALKVGNIDAAVESYVDSEKDSRRGLFDTIRTNDPNGLVLLGKEMGTYELPVPVYRRHDSALYVVIVDLEGQPFEYELSLRRENGAWKILQL